MTFKQLSPMDPVAPKRTTFLGELMVYSKRMIKYPVGLKELNCRSDQVDHQSLGMAPPESFMPARRLRTDAIRSPITDTIAMTNPQIAPCDGSNVQFPKSNKWERWVLASQGMRAPIPAEAPNPPNKPSTVLPGLMEGAILVRPIVLPTRRAPMSLNLATSTIQRQKKSPKPMHRIFRKIGLTKDADEIMQKKGDK